MQIRYLLEHIKKKYESEGNVNRGTLVERSIPSARRRKVPLITMRFKSGEISLVRPESLARESSAAYVRLPRTVFPLPHLSHLR